MFFNSILEVTVAPYFSLKLKRSCGVLALFGWVCYLFRLFGRPGPLLGAFGKILGSIVEVADDHLGCICSTLLVIVLAAPILGSHWSLAGWWGYAKRQLLF